MQPFLSCIVDYTFCGLHIAKSSTSTRLLALSCCCLRCYGVVVVASESSYSAYIRSLIRRINRGVPNDGRVRDTSQNTQNPRNTLKLVSFLNTIVLRRSCSSKMSHHRPLVWRDCSITRL